MNDAQVSSHDKTHSPEGPGVPESRIGLVKERIDPVFETDVMSKTEHLFRYAYADRRSEKTILDIGCGVGYGSHRLLNGGRRITSIDVSLEALRYGTQQYPGPDYVRASGEHLPFPDNSFDAVTAFEIIEHLESPDRFLKEIGRVVKPGGHLFISNPNPRHFWHLFRHHMRGIPYPDKINPMNVYHVREYPYDEFIQILEDQHFLIQSQIGQTIWMGFLNRCFHFFRMSKLLVYMGYFVPRYAVTVVIHARNDS